jgi:thiamine-phosphate diphosphorylase
MFPDRRPLLCLVTDRARLCSSCDAPRAHRCVIAQVRAALDAGVDLVQIRERSMEAAALMALVTEAVSITRGASTRILVNDRLDVAMAAGADGVHLRADSISVDAARAVAPRAFLIGRSVHLADEAARDAARADYVIAGTVFASASKPPGPPGPSGSPGNRLLGERGLAAIVHAVHVPVLAIGGLTIGNIQEVAAAGAAGIAAIGLFLGETAVGGCRSGPLGGVVAAARARFDSLETAL